jgi:Mlc titration factor MtfA (ptsG expression regulator)
VASERRDTGSAQFGHRGPRGAVLNWIRRLRQDRTLKRRAIPDELWQLTLARFPFLAWRHSAEIDQLRRLTTLFLADKEFTGGHGLVIEDNMAVAIAAQACLPILNLGLGWYDAFVGIVVHADAVVAQREFLDSTGVVHEYEEELTGEAMQGGPVMLSWSDVDQGCASSHEGYNVVIHEFVHVLDMRDGVADGVPPLPDGASRIAWRNALESAYADFVERVESGEDTWLDPYAAEAPEEFFAVTSEAFFVSPQELMAHYPSLYEQLRSFFRQDPAAHCPQGGTARRP